jgi:RNA polymerase sigma factor (sigma-70 family)
MNDPRCDPTAAELSRLRSGIRIMALSALGDADAAEEVAQESLARVVSAIRQGSLRDPLNLGAFGRAIARHVIVDTLRGRQRQTSLDPDQEPASEGDPLVALVSAEQAEQVRAALERLPRGDRELLRLCFFEAMTPQQLADRLGEPSARIRKRKERAIGRLRIAFLGATGHAPGPAPTQHTEAKPALARPGAME